MVESLRQQSDEDAKIERLVDSGKYSYDEARTMVTGIKSSPIVVAPSAPDERTLAREKAHQENTEIYKLTGVPTPEQAADAQAAMQGDGYQETHTAADQVFEASIGDPIVANAIRAARASRAAQAQSLASSTRTQVK